VDRNSHGPTLLSQVAGLLAENREVVGLVKRS
jgi:hypothetical protein